MKKKIAIIMGTIVICSAIVVPTTMELTNSYVTSKAASSTNTSKTTINKTSSTTKTNTATKTNSSKKVTITKKNVITEYNKLLQTATSDKTLYTFVEKNIKLASKKNADQLINGIIGFQGQLNKVDFIRLAKKSTYCTAEMKAFLKLMSTSQKTPAIKDGQIVTTLNDLLERSVSFENHMAKYPTGITNRYAYEMYCELLSAAITGGYNEATNTPNLYQSTDGPKVDGHAVDAYTMFTPVSGGKKTLQILSEYTKLLSENNNAINDTVAAYYNSIYNTIADAILTPAN